MRSRRGRRSWHACVHTRPICGNLNVRPVNRDPSVWRLSCAHTRQVCVISISSNLLYLVELPCICLIILLGDRFLGEVEDSPLLVASKENDFVSSDTSYRWKIWDGRRCGLIFFQYTDEIRENVSKSTYLTQVVRINTRHAQTKGYVNNNINFFLTKGLNLNCPISTFCKWTRCQR